MVSSSWKAVRGHRVVRPLSQKILEPVSGVEQRDARERARELVTELGTAKHLGRSRLLDDVADFVRRQTRVDAHERATGERHTEVAEEQWLRVQREKRDTVALFESSSFERGREAPGAGAEVAPRVFDLAVHDGDVVRVRVAGTFQKVRWEQFLAVDSHAAYHRTEKK